MGVIRSVFNKLDQTQPLMQEAAEHLLTAESLAKLKCDYFREVLEGELISAGTGEHMKDIPVHHILAYTSETHAYISSSASIISKTVNKSLNKFVSGGRKNVMDGIGGLLSGAITALFGNTQGDENEIQDMYIATDILGGIYRLDYKAWNRNLNSKSLKQDVEQIFSIVMCKSTPDVSKMDFNDFKVLFAQSLPSNLKPADLQAEMTQVEKDFNDLKKGQQN